ncbi:TetR/AcrR family transcriptional regulator [Paenibacillus sp. PAMC21692]|uniref:TetR/AcrR family transcriptional regulator n=1 Tax=Paenibacillus sp. PAMC21692 TaxID=2762320 RepID=UPI00164D463F|nr:TetR/AcrR family transcriptional regulator [Paenibacillus sp. PAMC21692]QNK54838.1 TetR/AcrR family transcriptional regulator [Paenibacillus sp. PAMC21692]
MSASDHTRSKEELSQAILDAASRLFLEQGIETVSMHQIAKCAGIGQGTLYRRYSNKADLCMAMMHDQFEKFSKDIGAYLQEHAAESPCAKIREVVAYIVRFLENKWKWMGIIQSQMIHEGVKTGEDFVQSPPYRFLHGVFAALLKEGADESDPRYIHADFISHSYISVLSPHTCKHLAFTKGYTSDRIVSEFVDSFVMPLFHKNGRERST